MFPTMSGLEQEENKQTPKRKTSGHFSLENRSFQDKVFLYKTASSRENKINASLAATAWGHPPKQKKWESMKPSWTFLLVLQGK